MPILTTEYSAYQLSDAVRKDVCVMDEIGASSRCSWRAEKALDIHCSVLQFDHRVVESVEALNDQPEGAPGAAFGIIPARPIDGPPKMRDLVLSLSNPTADGKPLFDSIRTECLLSRSRKLIFERNERRNVAQAARQHPGKCYQ